MRKIAIVGKATVCRGSAPVSDPSWEIWALGWDQLPRVSRRFEMHSPVSDPEAFEVASGYGCSIREALQKCKEPVYMQDRLDEFPTSVKYPLTEVIDCIRRDYFCSTFAFMLGLAIHEKVDRIGIWGVDLFTFEEYAYQRPNAEWLIGVAEGKGIPVYVPPRTALMSSPGRYGWDQEAFLKQIEAHKEMAGKHLPERQEAPRAPLEAA